MAHIFVTNSLTIENIIIDGSDMTPGLYTSGSACRKSRTQCCTYDSTTDTVSSGASCTSSSSDYQDWSTDTTAYQTSYKGDRKYGIFVFEYLRDYSGVQIPSLTIKNCQIQNFVYSKYHTSFIQMSSFGGTLTIQDTVFKRFFFPHGLISNAHITLDRNLFGFSSFNGENCKGLQNPAVDDCHSITIKDCDFINYNPNKVTNLHVNNVHSIEGSVLTVHNIDGPITIQGSTFQ